MNDYFGAFSDESGEEWLDIIGFDLLGEFGRARWRAAAGGLKRLVYQDFHRGRPRQHGFPNLPPPRAPDLNRGNCNPRTVLTSYTRC